jgi:hypothetical protein
MLQSDYAGPVTAPRQLADTRGCWNAAPGGGWVVRERWTLALDSVHAPSHGEDDSVAGSVAQSFPQNSTDWTRCTTNSVPRAVPRVLT